MHNQDNLRTAALFYADRGLPVFPVYEIAGGRCACRNDECTSPAKHPRTPNGCKDASTERAVVAKWWDRWPGANVAIATGRGVVVVDVDSYNGGDEGLDTLCGTDRLPETVEALTGGGGRHLWFKVPPDVKVGCKTGLAAGVDIRGEGGYVVAPPSMHTSGRVYQWELSGRIDEHELAMLPQWLLARLGTRSGTIPIRKQADPLPASIPEGTRRTKLFSTACAWRRYGMNEQEILAGLRPINSSRCQPPLTDEEIIKIGREAARFTPGSVPIRVMEGSTPPSVPEPVESYPSAVWPVKVKDYIERQAVALSAPMDFVGVPMIAVLGMAIGNRRAVEIKPGWTEYPCIWSGIVGRSGARKSPAISKALLPLMRIQQWCNEQYDTAMDRYTALEPEDREDPPARRQAYTADITVEALAEVLRINPRGVGIVRDELTSLALSMNQYRGGKGGDRQAYMSLWNSEQVIVNRVNLKEPIVVENPMVCITGGLPPDVLNDLADRQGRDDGFVNRFLLAMPEPVPVRWTDVSVSEKVEDDYCEVFNALWHLPDLPAVLTATPQARSRFQEWYDEHHQEMDAPDFPDNLSGAFAKMAGYCARLALILQLVRHVCDGADGNRIDDKSVLGAAALVTYFKSHTRLIHDRIHADKRECRVQKAAEWLRKRGGRSTGREMLNAKLGGVKDMDGVKILINDLISYGYVNIDTEAGRSDSIVVNLNT